MDDTPAQETTGQRGVSLVGTSGGFGTSAFDRWKFEIGARRVAIEDEWQTAEDWLDHPNYQEADYFLERMICEAKKLQLHLQAGGQVMPNNRDVPTGTHKP